MEWVTLHVSALNSSESAPGHFVLVLEEQASRRRLPVIIGAYEAQAIALYMEKLTPPRPLTHDLFAQTLRALQVTLLRVCIYGMVEGAYAARLEMRTADGLLCTTDARTSDAVALAIRLSAPVVIDYALWDAHALHEQTPMAMLRGSLHAYSMEELEMMLSDLLEKEDYEGAAKIRDMIAKKQG